ncbi:hypothetical protein CC80DRAFT_572334 [Byssothecium circinans]|uniref:Uncharacterized protein n=1 Tax=Byssothecium circinans TaxID=147558 RepID=A0A6A5TIX5_9PLEO|nr:hypothetical protein CC80DRAFT_572334 [Byssothecium circinans]
MAPSNMFSRLRPGHAKRNAASLTSPDSVSSPPAPSPSQSSDHFTSPRLLVPDNASSMYASSSSPVSPLPPQLPPIPRVASKLERTGDSSLLSPQHAIALGKRESMASAQGGLPSPSSSSSYTTQEQVSPGGFRSQGQSLAQVVELATHSRLQSSTAHAQKSKSRLNIRNPMSLLMRRRSAQILDPLADESLVTQRSPSNIPPIPDNYDPSIRGRIVHDFSAPRPNRNFSYNNAYADEQRKVDASPPKIDRAHTPVFREHFDDDTSYEQSQANIRAEQLANSDFVKRNSYVPPAPPGRSPPPPPPLPKDTPPPPPEPAHDFSSSVLSPVQEAPSPSSPPSVSTPRTRKSTKTPPSSRSRATSLNDAFTPAGLPTHLTSRASRFSFQMGGGDSAAQEKILEDRHKEKEAEKASKQVRMSTNTIEDDYDEYGMDDFDMDGGYEEDIPMLGEEDEYAGLGDQTMSSGMAAFDFSSLSIQPNNINTMSPISMVDGTHTPRDGNGNPIGFATSEDVLQKMSFHNQPANVTAMDSIHGLGLKNLPQTSIDPVRFTPAETPEETNVTATKELALGDADLDDDLYFDDGMIDEQGGGDAVEFNEDVFDDPNGPLFERRMKPQSADEFRSALALRPPDGLSSETGYDADDDTLLKHFEKSEPTLAHKTSRAQHKPVPDYGNIDAYHSALADAANRAEADGRFARKASSDIGRSKSGADDSSSISNSRPSLVPDDGRFSQETTGFPPDDDGFGMDTSFMDDYDYSDYDSALENDPMIAEANAEVLANDYENFYGSEFNFYAAAQGDANNSYGGFFGPSGLGRTISGRNAVREPNLTPITERSEYSTRNSFISVRGSQQLTSPGLAQLARISPYGWRGDEEDMSLDSLMKLRKGAFGGTSSAPSQSGSPRNSSPMGMQFVPRAATPAGNRMQEQSERESEESTGADDEALSAAVNGDLEDDEAQSSNEDEDDRPDSPTLTASDYNSISSPTSHLPASDLSSPLPQMHMHSPPAVPVHIPSGYPFTLPFSPSFISQPLQSPTSVPLPSSPPPLTVHTSFQNPPASAIQSPALSSTTATTSTAPRRQSFGLASPVSTTSPVTPGGSANGWKVIVAANGGHSRKGSASADSVAYVREQDEEGADRWVLERRRTAESGELELVGRSIVEGGRI